MFKNIYLSLSNPIPGEVRVDTSGLRGLPLVLRFKVYGPYTAFWREYLRYMELKKQLELCYSAWGSVGPVFVYQCTWGRYKVQYGIG